MHLNKNKKKARKRKKTENLGSHSLNRFVPTKWGLKDSCATKTSTAVQTIAIWG